MVFKPTSCIKRGRVRGFTLAEYMVALSIGLIALAAVCSLWAYASKTCAVLLNYVDMSTTSKNALDRISQQVRVLQFAIAKPRIRPFGLQRVDGNAGLVRNSRQDICARNSDAEHQEECRYD